MIKMAEQQMNNMQQMAEEQLKEQGDIRDDNDEKTKELVMQLIENEKKELDEAIKQSLADEDKRRRMAAIEEEELRRALQQSLNENPIPQNIEEKKEEPKKEETKKEDPKKEESKKEEPKKEETKKEETKKEEIKKEPKREETKKEETKKEETKKEETKKEEPKKEEPKKEEHKKEEHKKGAKKEQQKKEGKKEPKKEQKKEPKKEQKKEEKKEEKKDDKNKYLENILLRFKDMELAREIILLSQQNNNEILANDEKLFIFNILNKYDDTVNQQFNFERNKKKTELVIRYNELNMAICNIKKEPYILISHINFRMEDLIEAVKAKEIELNRLMNKDSEDIIKKENQAKTLVYKNKENKK
jgi:hypothetical protein